MPKNTKLPINITIMSVGGRGGNVLERLGDLDSKGIKRVAVGTSGKVFNRLVVVDKIELPNDKRLQSSSFDEVTVGELIDTKRAEINSVLQNTDVLFLLGNVSSQTSAAECCKLASMAQDKGTLVFFLGTLPFAFEGVSKQSFALKNKELLEEHIDGVLIVDSNKLLNNELSASDALTKTDQIIAEMVQELTDVVLKFGVINVDFADIKTTIAKAGELFFNTVVGDPSEPQSIVDRLFSKTILMDRVNRLGRALYVIYADKNVSMEEISALGTIIQNKVDQTARIIFGLVNEENMENKMKVVLIGG